MASLQLLRTVQKKQTPISKRKAFAIAAAALVAGGGLAYATSSLHSRQTRQGHYSHLNGADIDKDESQQDQKNTTLTRNTRQKKIGLKSIKALTGILLARMGRKGLHNILSLALVLVLRTALSNRLAKLQGFLFRAAFLRRVPMFLRLVTENFLLCLIQSAFISTAKYFTGAISLHFRKILTDHIHADYFQNMTYYKMTNVHGRITNPEQRIVSDIPKFCSELSDLICEDLSSVFDGLLYTWRLCSYASPRYLFWILGYVSGAGILIGNISPSFGKLMAKEQQLEGDYRQLHSRLRSHSESIAFYGGQDREESHIKQKFKTLVRHRSLVQHTNWWFGMIQDFFLKYLGATFAVVLIIEPFFSGKLRPDNSTLGRAEMLSNLRYHTSVIISLFHALGTIFSSSRRLNRLSGYADRIRELMVVAKELRSAGGSHSITKSDTVCNFMEANHIEFDSVKVVTPTGNTLVDNLTLKVEPGSNLLITGPNGSGKSSLFRVLGGLWPLVGGRITKPGVGSDLNNEIFYVPQRPYTAFGTLREQLIYPLTASEEIEPLTDEAMRELLKNVDLEYLLDRYPPEKEINWGDELSLGEQQRLGMARLFYHKPKFAILDECTSAVTTDMEERFCARVRAMGTSCITISHRPALVAFHDTVLSLDGEGGWFVKKRESGSSSHSLDQQAMDVKGAKTERKSDALTVQQVFDSAKLEASYTDTNSAEPYLGEVLAKSWPEDTSGPVPQIPPLKACPQKMATRVASLLKILVPTLYDKQGAQFVAVALLVMSRTWISDRIASLNGTSVKFVLEQNKVAFIRLVGISVLQSAGSSVVAPSLRFLTAILHLGWRIRLTNHLSKYYFSKNAFYKVFHLSDKNIDADQRISNDVDKLSDDLSGLVTGMVKPIVDILWFTWRMKILTGRRGVVILYAYMFLGLGFLRSVTPDFESLTSHEQQLESTFRFMHARLRTHAESVAFFGGGPREKAMIEAKFKDLQQHSEDLLKKKWLFGIVDEFVTKQLPHNVTWGLSLMYAMKHKGDRALTSVQGELAHALRFLASVVTQSFLAFGDILELYGKFMELSGGISRIMELEELLHAAQQDTKPPLPNPLNLIQERRNSWESSMEPETILFSEVDIVTPAQKLLVRKLTFRVTPQKSLLVTGPNGSGKSSVIRVLRGLWPTASGKITKPNQIDEYDDLSSFINQDVFYVPQRPYTALGTLRDQIIYPLTLAEAISKTSRNIQQDADCNAAERLDQHLRNILENIRLLYLLEREGGFDATANWEDMLSLGEQQRLGMARLFFHNPKFGILDECTNATSIDVEEQLYRHAQSLGITVVTISQRPALIPFHVMELRLIDGEGNWELRSLRH